MKAHNIGERDGWTCWLCGHRVDPHAPIGSPSSPTVDHVVPRSRGGSNDVANLRLAHRRCNGRRGNHLPELGWPDDFGLLDAPPLWRSLRHLIPSESAGNTRRRRSKRRAARKRASAAGQGIVVALAPTAETAEAAGNWARQAARRFVGGTWTATTEPTGIADCHVVRLTVEGTTLDPGRPVD